jgi:hypothetical protein
VAAFVIREVARGQVHQRYRECVAKAVDDAVLPRQEIEVQEAGKPAARSRPSLRGRL